MGFDPCNCILKIQESSKTPTPQGGSSFGSAKVYSLTLSCTLESMQHDSWLPFGPQPYNLLSWLRAQSQGCNNFCDFVNYFIPFTSNLYCVCYLWLCILYVSQKNLDIFQLAMDDQVDYIVLTSYITLLINMIENVFSQQI